MVLANDRLVSVAAVRLYDCSVGQADCSQCLAVPPHYGCVWCGGNPPWCAYRGSCPGSPEMTCPPPIIKEVTSQVPLQCYLAKK